MESVTQEHFLKLSCTTGILTVVVNEVELAVTSCLIHCSKSALCGVAYARRQCIHHRIDESPAQCVHAESLLQVRIYTVVEFITDGNRCHTLASIAENLGCREHEHSVLRCSGTEPRMAYRYTYASPCPSMQGLR